MSLTTVLGALADHGDKTPSIVYADRTVLPGYHVTEVKAGSFVTLDCGASEVQWVVLSYLLAVTTLIVGAGRLGDLVGRRRLLLTGIALFGIASAGAALTPAFGF